MSALPASDPSLAGERFVSRTEQRADDYRARAQEAADRAAGCDLARVREQHEAAAASWAALALAEDRRTLAAQVRYPPATKGRPTATIFTPE